MPEAQASSSTPDILTQIVATKRSEVESLRARAADLRGRALAMPPARSLHRALAGGTQVRVIAEVKRRSPGAGDIRPALDPAGLAAHYGANGAAALSVLTDAPWFGGSLDDLAAARAAVTLPVLRKDFTIDGAQIDEARAAGADAVLLIVRILDDAQLADLHGHALTLGLDVLVETHDANEVERALRAGARIIGVNNRDLATFRTDLGVTEGLLEHLPPDVVIVSESGIRSPSDVARLGAAGVDAVLVGETLLRATDPGATLARLAAQPRVRRGP